MYTLVVDGHIVWSNETPDVGIYSAKLSLDVNSTNSLEIVVAKDHPALMSVNMLKSVIGLYQDNAADPIWTGRCINRKQDFYGNTTYTFEGILAYLYDSIQPPAVYTGQSIETIFSSLIDVHNQQVEPWKRFHVGNITVEDHTDTDTYWGKGRKDPDDEDDPYSIYKIDTNKKGTNQTELITSYESTFDAINNLLINNLAGHLVIRYENGTKYIDYLKEYLPSEGQVILFGSNLLDYSSTTDYSSLCTGVLPLGYSRGEDDYDKDDPDNPEDPSSIYQKQKDPLENVKSKLTISSVNGGSKILWNADAVNTYGRVVKTLEWSECKDVNLLLKKAQRYLYNTQFDNLTLECKVVDLHFLDNTEGPLHHMHMVRVKSQPNGLDRMMPISKMDIDLLNPANTNITLGATYNSITGQLAGTQGDVSRVTGQAANISSTMSNNNKTAWTNITQTDTQISLEAHKRETAVDELGNTINIAKDAILKITAEQISSEVSERITSEGKLKEEYSTAIKQTARSISLEAQQRKDGEDAMKASITVEANKISSKVSQANYGLSLIEQKVDSITSTVKDTQNNIESYYKQTPTSFSFGFNNQNMLQMTYTKGDGTTTSTTGFEVTADHIKFDGHTIKLNTYGARIYMDGSTISIWNPTGDITIKSGYGAFDGASVHIGTNGVAISGGGIYNLTPANKKVYNIASFNGSYLGSGTLDLSSFLTSSDLSSYAKKSDVYTKSEVDAKLAKKKNA